MKFTDWVNYQKDKKTFFLRDWADGKSICAIGNANSKGDKEGFDWVGFTSNPNKPEDWRFLSLDIVMLSLSELFGKDNVRKVLDRVQPYEKIKDTELTK